MRSPQRGGRGPNPVGGTGPEDRAFLATVAAGLGLPGGGALVVERRRTTDRSTLTVVTVPLAGDDTGRWIVKQPATVWQPDESVAPLTAAQEFATLRRLHQFLAAAEAPVRVPRPECLLPDIGALVMEYVEGPTVRSMLKPAAVANRRPLLRAIHESGTFLRFAHEVEPHPSVEVRADREGDAVLHLADELLAPRGLAVPDDVTEILRLLPPVTLASRQVLLHGDASPDNVIMATDGTVVGLDPMLRDVGSPEDDLARFTIKVNRSQMFLPDFVAPPLAAFRRALERQLLSGYYGSPDVPALYDLRMLQQLVPRWCRLRDLTEQRVTRRLLSARLAMVGARVQMLMRESAHRLQQGLVRPGG